MCEANLLKTNNTEIKKQSSVGTDLYIPKVQCYDTKSLLKGHLKPAAKRKGKKTNHEHNVEFWKAPFVLSCPLLGSSSRIFLVCHEAHLLFKV